LKKVRFLRKQIKVALIPVVGLTFFLGILIFYIFTEPVKLTNIITRYFLIFIILFTFLFIGLGFLSRWILSGK